MTKFWRGFFNSYGTTVYTGSAFQVVLGSLLLMKIWFGFRITLNCASARSGAGVIHWAWTVAAHPLLAQTFKAG